MTKYYFHNLIYILLLVGLFINSCYGQVNTRSPKNTTIASKPSPEVIGTPPPLVSHPTPVNDPSLIGQYIRTIFQDSKGNFWFGPVGQSVARYDEKTLKFYSKIEFFMVIIVYTMVMVIVYMLLLKIRKVIYGLEQTAELLNIMEKPLEVILKKMD